jgi:hypothetical protein
MPILEAQCAVENTNMHIIVTGMTATLAVICNGLFLLLLSSPVHMPSKIRYEPIEK